mmetsp:Transcript_12334/g.20894  ORF Transcript_12334/g.20894 Transcript_12334/m.20894 type:complete len:135 (-) Transcript_12334:41-445(-)
MGVGCATIGASVGGCAGCLVVGMNVGSAVVGCGVVGCGVKGVDGQKNGLGFWTLEWVQIVVSIPSFQELTLARTVGLLGSIQSGGPNEMTPTAISDKKSSGSETITAGPPESPTQEPWKVEMTQIMASLSILSS